MATTNLSSYDKATVPNANNLRFGIVVSKWNNDITENLFKGAKKTLLDCGTQEDNIHRIDVPGAYELVYGSKFLLSTQKYDAIIAIGCVIQGETKHFDFVCQSVSKGIMDLNTHCKAPTIFCVLTDNNKQQSIDRSGGKHGNKGVECAIAAIKMATLHIPI